jgi:hypothetical protein
VLKIDDDMYLNVHVLAHFVKTYYMGRAEWRFTDRAIKLIANPTIGVQIEVKKCQKSYHFNIWIKIITSIKVPRNGKSRWTNGPGIPIPITWTDPSTWCTKPRSFRFWPPFKRRPLCLMQILLCFFGYQWCRWRHTSGFAGERGWAAVGEAYAEAAAQTLTLHATLQLSMDDTVELVLV